MIDVLCSEWGKPMPTLSEAWRYLKVSVIATPPVTAGLGGGTKKYDGIGHTLLNLPRGISGYRGGEI